MIQHYLHLRQQQRMTAPKKRKQVAGDPLGTESSCPWGHHRHPQQSMAISGLAAMFCFFPLRPLVPLGGHHLGPSLHQASSSSSSDAKKSKRVGLVSCGVPAWGSRNLMKRDKHGWWLLLNHHFDVLFGSFMLFLNFHLERSYPTFKSLRGDKLNSRAW